MKKTLALTLLLIGYWSSAQETPASFTLDEAIEWGFKHNRTIKNASIELQKAHKEKWKTISIGFPQINANLQYQNFLEQPVSLIPAQFFGGEVGEFAEVTFGTSQSAMGNVELSQLLFDGTYVVGLQGIKHYIKTAENVLEKSQLEVKKEIVNWYTSTLVAKQNIDVLSQNIDVVKNNISEATLLFENGFTEEETVEQLQLTLASLNTQIQYLEKSFELAQNVMKLLLGIDFLSPLKLTNSLEELAALKQLEPEQQMDLSNNIDIRLAENNLTSEELLYRLEKAKSLPSFSAFINGMYMGNSNSFTFTEPTQKWFGSSAFGLRVKVPIFSSFGRSASSQKVKLTMMQAKNTLEETEEKTTLEYSRVRNELELAQKTVETARESLRLAERIEKKNQTKFFEGLSGSFELRQAQTQLYQAQQYYIQQLKTLIIKKTSLEILINTPQ